MFGTETINFLNTFLVYYQLKPLTWNPGTHEPAVYTLGCRASKTYHFHVLSNEKIGEIFYFLFLYQVFKIRNVFTYLLNSDAKL